MSNERGKRQRCEECDVIVMQNVANRCKDCGIRESSNNENEENEEIVNEVEGTSGENRVSEVRSSTIHRCGEIKVKGGVTKTKKKGIKIFLR